MRIFDSYTGNAMLNNALMTIEALGNLSNVSEITPDILLHLYNEKELLRLNKRLKSYTMLFTKNGPLHNDKAKGDKIYDALMKTIFKSFESEGEKICEISGLKFNVTFNTVYENALKSIDIPENEINKKDITIGRTWFPLIGGLGSDAQALPQAKFTVQIHPICIAILQFLPLSSLLYKGGILLIDSSNFDFSKQFISENLKELTKRIQTTSSTESVENVRDFSKGNYILKAIEILERKDEFEESYSDLNLWSFSNSGTGASCEIDRVPNALIQKLIRFKNYSPEVSEKLKTILNSQDSSYNFLNAFEDNSEWWLLYPNVFGSGKKKKEYEGVSVAFLEAYFKETGNAKQTEYAKYIAYLIEKYQSKYFEKYLGKTDAWNDKDYRVDLNAVLVEAAKNEEWNLNHQLQIIDDPEQLPLRNTFYKLHKLIHFYFQNKVYYQKLPKIENKKTNAKVVCEWLIALIKQYENKSKIINKLTKKQDYSNIDYNELLLDSFALPDLSLTTIAKIFYDANFYFAKSGLNELMRIFFNQPDQNIFESTSLLLPQDLLTLDASSKKWFTDFSNFSNDYQAYFFEKYENKDTEAKPYNKFKKLIDNLPNETSYFLNWFRDAIEKTNEYLQLKEGYKLEKWTEALLYSPNDDFAISFSKFAIKFSLLKQHQRSVQNNKPILIS